MAQTIFRGAASKSKLRISDYRFTKIEYAMLMLAQGLAANPNSHTPDIGDGAQVLRSVAMQILEAANETEARDE